MMLLLFVLEIADSHSNKAFVFSSMKEIHQLSPKYYSCVQGFYGLVLSFLE